MALTEKMNLVTVKEGRLPECSGEIFVDDQFLENQGYEIGDTLTLKKRNRIRPGRYACLLSV